jgi:thiosulfate dehydrogenase
MILRRWFIILVISASYGCTQKSNVSDHTGLWIAPDTSKIPHDKEGDLIRYGRDLIVHTARYLGPKGKVLHISNGMNCENCHIDAGTQLWGNNFSMVASAYPKYRSRSGQYESIAFRVNGCMQRSLNGTLLDTASLEMKALIAYLKWVGKDVSKKQPVSGSGVQKLPYLQRAADPIKGKQVFTLKCQACHGANGAGLFNEDSTEYLYPPLWGVHSYNIGAGLYRLSSFAGYVKNNMPFGTTYHKPQLTDEEAWDVAAYVNSQPHPYKDLRNDWHKMADKPIDYPFGPYADHFSETVHKYGPYPMIQKADSKK